MLDLALRRCVALFGTRIRSIDKISSRLLLRQTVHVAAQYYYPAVRADVLVLSTFKCTRLLTTTFEICIV